MINTLAQVWATPIRYTLGNWIIDAVVLLAVLCVATIGWLRATHWKRLYIANIPRRAAQGPLGIGRLVPDHGDGPDPSVATVVSSRLIATLACISSAPGYDGDDLEELLADATGRSLADCRTAVELTVQSGLLTHHDMPADTVGPRPTQTTLDHLRHHREIRRHDAAPEQP